MLSGHTSDTESADEIGNDDSSLADSTKLEENPFRGLASHHKAASEFNSGIKPELSPLQHSLSRSPDGALRPKPIKLEVRMKFYAVNHYKR